MKKTFPIDHNVPISKAVRAGDFVFTSAFGPWLFDPKNVTFDEAGNILDDGTGLGDMPFEEQVHKTIGFIKHALDVLIRATLCVSTRSMPPTSPRIRQYAAFSPCASTSTARLK